MAYKFPSLIWLADDDQDDREIFNDITDQIGVESRYVMDGIQLMALLRQNVHRLPDYIFLDLHMPLKDGLECLEEIKNDDLLKKIPVIIYSNAASAKLIERAIELGATKFLEKPSSVVKLKQMILDVFAATGKCIIIFAVTSA